MERVIDLSDHENGIEDVQHTKGKGSRRRLVSFDLICLFSCICVTVVHFNASVSGYNGTFVYPSNSIVPNFYLENRVYLGGIGVSLFFMLSGARLMYTYRGIRTFFQRRVRSIYPMFWIAYAVATAIDFLYYKGMSLANPALRIFSVLGLDGYLCSLGVLSFDFYKLGEWFLGCILLLYILFPLLHWGIEKHPALTVAVSLLIYAIGIRLLDDKTFILRIPEMLFGMLYVKYHWEDQPAKLTLCCGSAFLLAWVCRNVIAPLTINIALCLLLFGALSWMSKWITNPYAKDVLAWLSKLSYPVFLVHHWLIDRLLFGFNLETMPKRWVWMLFGIYLTLTIVLAQMLSRLNDEIMVEMKRMRTEKQ